MRTKMRCGLPKHQHPLVPRPWILVCRCRTQFVQTGSEGIREKPGTFFREVFVEQMSSPCSESHCMNTEMRVCRPMVSA